MVATIKRGFMKAPARSFSGKESHRRDRGQGFPHRAEGIVGATPTEIVLAA